MSVNEDPSTWRLTTLGGIPIKLKSRVGSFSDEDADMTEVYILQTSRFQDFILETFPSPTLFLNGLLYPPRRKAPGTTLQTIRVSYGGLQGLDSLIDPFNSDTGAPAGTYEPFMEITVQYGTSMDNDTDPDPDNPLTFLEISAAAAGVFLTTQPTGQAVWEAGGGDPQQNVQEAVIPQTLTEPETEWSVRWSQIPWGFINATLIARLRSKLGKVNEGVMSLFHDAPAETVMFLGYTYRQQFTWRSGSGGQPPVELDLKFLEKNLLSPEGIQVTHNHVYRPGHGYRKMTIDGDPLHDTTNLDEIFAP
jgi:hypothetical protein